MTGHDSAQEFMKFRNVNLHYPDIPYLTGKLNKKSDHNGDLLQSERSGAEAPACAGLRSDGPVSPRDMSARWPRCSHW